MNTAQQSRYKSLYKKHVNALHRQGKAASTIDVYSRAVRRITEFFDRCPDTLNEEHLKDYFTALVHTHSWSTVKVDRNGLQFFYTHVLKKEWTWIEMVKPPVKKVLPDVLSREEVTRFINSARELRYQVFILTSYSMGLRLGETLNLTVGDIDSQRMRVHVRQGKGKKDRSVTLPQRTLHALRTYWTTHRNPTFIFPRGKDSKLRHQAHQPIDRGGLQKAFKAILQHCRIRKNITPHSLRHCYGTHLMEANIHLRAIQYEMGHECPKTTAIYTQLTDEVTQDTRTMINALMDELDIALDGEV